MTLPRQYRRTAAGKAAVLLCTAAFAAAGAGAPAPAAARETLVPLSPCTSFTNPPPGSIGSPALSADGAKIAFLHCYDPAGLNPLGHPQLFLAGVDDSAADVRQVTVSDSIANPGPPVFSLDGAFLYFTAELAATGVRELFRAAVAGGDPERLTFQTAATGFAAIGRPAALGAAGACFSSGSDLLDEGLDIASNSRHVYRVDPAGVLTRVTSPGDLLRNAEVLAGSTDGGRLAYIAEDPLLPHSHPFRPILLDVNSGLALPLTPDLGASTIQSAATPFAARFVFSSTADYLGRSLTGTPQLFRTAVRDSVPADSLEQLTTVQFSGAEGAAADSSGGVVAFESFASVLFNETTGTWRVYSGTGDHVIRLSTGRSAGVAAGGGRIAYMDDSDSLGLNADHSLEIFSVRPDGSDRRQHSRFVTGISESPDVSTDGQWVVFTSTGDLTGGNVDGNREIFAVRTDGSALTQLTHTLNEDNREPCLSGDGSLVAFSSTADLVAGMNPDGNYEIFRCRSDGSAMEQLTATTAGASGKPALSTTGDVVSFVTTANLGGGAGMGQGRVAVRHADGSILLVTPSSDRQIEILEMNDDATRIAILTQGNLSGLNPSHWRRVFTVSAGGGAVTTPAVPGIIQPGSLGMSPDGGWLATAAQDGFLRLFPWAGGKVDTLFGAAGMSPAWPGVSSDARFVVFSVLAPSGEYFPGDAYVLERGQTVTTALIGATSPSPAKPAAISGDGATVTLVMTGPDSLNPDGSTEVFAAKLGVTAVTLESFTAARLAGGRGVQVEWRAAADAQHLFFRVLRSDRRDGYFAAVSDRIMGRGPRYTFVDEGASSDECWYRLEAVERSGRLQRFGPIRASNTGPGGEPRLTVRRGAGRFPFIVSLEMPYPARAHLCLFDVAGRLVRTLHDGVAAAGTTTIPWDGRNVQGMEVASGAYFLRLNRQPGTVLIMSR